MSGRKSTPRGQMTRGNNSGPAVMLMPPHIRSTFMPPPPLKSIPPSTKIRKHKMTGVMEYLKEFEKSTPKRVVQPTPKALKAQKDRQRDKDHQEKLRSLIEKYRQEQRDCEGKYQGMNCYNTLFVGRLAYEVTERKLLREMEAFGPVRDIKLVMDPDDKSRGYAFLEYENEEDMKRAYRAADGMKIEGRPIVVDVERGHTVPTFLPRRLGGGLGGTRLGGKDKNIRAPGRYDPNRPPEHQRPPPSHMMDHGPPGGGMPPQSGYGGYNDHRGGYGGGGGGGYRDNSRPHGGGYGGGGGPPPPRGGDSWGGGPPDGNRRRRRSRSRSPERRIERLVLFVILLGIMTNETEESAAERKRKRLEAWKQRRQQQQQQQQQQPPVPTPAPVKVSLSLKPVAAPIKKQPVIRSAPPKPVNPFDIDNDDDDSDEDEGPKKGKLSLGLGFSLTDPPSPQETTEKPAKRRRGRWDAGPVEQTTESIIPPARTPTSDHGTHRKADPLESFMDKLQAGAMGSVATQVSGPANGKDLLSIDVGGSMMRVPKLAPPQQSPVSGGVITPDQIASLAAPKKSKATADPDALYTPSDWESDSQHGGNTSTSEAETDDEEEEKARRAFIDALKSLPGPSGAEEAGNDKPQTASEVRSEKQRREQRLRELEKEAETARTSAEAAAAPELGRLYNDTEGGVMEEAERNLDAAMAAPDALQVLADLNKKKELKAVDHSKVDYIPFQKNLFIIPRSLANLSSDEVANIRGKQKIKVRGHGAPPPVSSFEQCGLSERIMKVLEKQNITNPFPVQAQCLPCIMAGRDVIGIAKTGSGKTLAYLLPMLRHILDQPPLGANESGPVGLVLAPARELAYQIHLVCKNFTKQLGLKSTAVYGGAGVAEQIGDLKRGTHICVATPGRLIDILTMQSGKILSLQRVTYVVMDEADRMYDMGFAPQISAILAAVRPDRQVVLFSATFPKSVENLARKSLKFPLEVIVGGRSVASDNVVQYAELVEEEDKFLRLLQLLGEHVDENKKAVVFVDTQVRADGLFEQLLRNGYVALSLHGGKEQEDRDSTISDFKKKDGPSVLVATGVAGRGLDVASIVCVINYSCPNHLEMYVHQVGRTGRADKKGVAYTFVNSTDEAKFAPNIVRALSEAGQSEHVSPELKALSDSFKEKVKKGEAKWAGSGYKGKGYTYDSSEMNEAQKLAHMEKRQALIEAGLLDPDEEDPLLGDTNKTDGDAVMMDEDGPVKETESEADKALDLQTKLTPELLALPGMKDAILRRVGIVKESDDDPSLGRPVQMGANHFVQEFEINDYPREARWKVTQRETTSRLQDEFQTAVTLKGEYFGPGRTPGEGERRLYLHLEATSERILANCVVEIKRLLNEETLRVGARSGGGGGHRYNVL
eukprot:Nitzschia sp. Nitz4//scaffold4_size323378//89118//93846//NITZ4_000641-RA/size323378-augustus-gene-0.9-mRNA-1//1//CDS//3329553342//6449//frame0